MYFWSNIMPGNKPPILQQFKQNISNNSKLKSTIPEVQHPNIAQMIAQGIGETYHQEIDVVLNTEIFRNAFLKHIGNEFSTENFDFILAVESIKNASPDKQQTALHKIYNEYIAENAPRRININSKEFSECQPIKTVMGNGALTQEKYNLAAYTNAVVAIKKMIDADTLTRFKGSDLGNIAAKKQNEINIKENSIYENAPKLSQELNKYLKHAFLKENQPKYQSKDFYRVDCYRSLKKDIDALLQKYNTQDKNKINMHNFARKMEKALQKFDQESKYIENLPPKNDKIHYKITVPTPLNKLMNDTKQDIETITKIYLEEQEKIRFRR